MNIMEYYRNEVMKSWVLDQIQLPDHSKANQS